MSRRLKVTLAVGLAFIVLAGFVSARTLRRGFSAHDQPSAIEAFIARTVRHWAVPADLRNENNPIALTPEVLAEARSHWADHCAICHGNDGKGQTAIGQQVYPKARDMTLPATQSMSDGELFSIIENGIRLTAMPGWGDGTAESAYGSWTLVHFIRHLPEIAPDELAEMTRMNPVSRVELEEEAESESFLEGTETAASEQHHH